MSATTETAVVDTRTASNEAVACEWCGIDFVRPVGRVGRPRLFCCDECKDAAARMIQIESLLASTVSRMSKARASEIRRRLWSMANAAGNVAGRGVEASRKPVAVRPEWALAARVLVEGGTNEDAAKAAGVEPNMIRAWRKAPAFRRHLDNARRAGAKD